MYKLPGFWADSVTMNNKQNRKTGIDFIGCRGWLGLGQDNKNNFKMEYKIEPLLSYDNDRYIALRKGFHLAD